MHSSAADHSLLTRLLLKSHPVVIKEHLQSLDPIQFYRSIWSPVSVENEIGGQLAVFR